jgi:hypothetical protein
LVNIMRIVSIGRQSDHATRCPAQPVISARPESVNALGDGRGARADDDAKLRRRLAATAPGGDRVDASIPHNADLQTGQLTDVYHFIV